MLVHGSHIEQRIFAGTKWLGRYQVQASRFMAQVIVLIIINAMISNDWNIGIMEESKKSQYKYCLIVKNREILKGVGVNVSLKHWNFVTYSQRSWVTCQQDNGFLKLQHGLKDHRLQFVPKGHGLLFETCPFVFVTNAQS